MKLFQQEPVAKELSLDEALYMLSAYKLGHSGYTNLRFDMKKRVEFPAYYRVKQHKDLITPQIDSLSKVTGVLFSLVASAERLITLLGIALQPGSYTMVAKEGLDGSERHAIYNQLGNVETHNMIIWMWVPLSVSQSQGECNEVWGEGAPCSPDAARPIMITMGKENSELLAKIVPPVDVEIGELQQNGVTVEDNGKMYTLKVEFHCSMNDGKMQKLLLGRGGGFCVLCPFSADEAVSPDQIKDGFEIGNVDIATLNALYENLADDDKGVKKHQGDYKDRMGLTQNPISAYNVATFPILHALLRGLD